MAQRVFLVEPKQLSISRDATDEKKDSQREQNSFRNIEDHKMVRSAGDGMEFKQNNSDRTIDHDWPRDLRLKRPVATSTPAVKESKKERKNEHRKSSKSILKELGKSDSIISIDEKKPTLLKEKEEDLKLEIYQLKQSNEKLIEEKLKLSKQLGMQTQVNSELKTLLVASVGEDLEEKLEKLTLRNATSERMLKRLKDELDQNVEELESMMIKSDVWRSKFLASKVMTDELASLKALTDSRYRECSSALGTLLEEHVQVSTTISSANRFLLRLAKITGCAEPEEDLEDCSSVDLAVKNHSLARIVTHSFIQGSPNIKIHPVMQKTSLEETPSNPGKGALLSEGEKKAKKVLEDSNFEQSEICKTRKDFLAHSRISHILATRYPMRCLTCKGCKGSLTII